MAFHINTWTVSGNLTKDPEVRTTANGATICNFTIAVPEREKNGAGEWVDRAEFVDCVAFGAVAKAMAQDGAKGVEAWATGRCRLNSWEAKDGSGKRYRMELVADSCKALPKPKTTDAEPVAAYYEEEIPF